MLFRPKPASVKMFSSEMLDRDISTMQKYGPCGLGDDAIYLGTYFKDRRYYIPLSSAKRIYKRVAMSKGGFTGKGMFISQSYIVVEYDDGKEMKSAFKREEQVDLLIAAIEESHPEIKTLSKEGEKRLEKIKREEEKRYKKNLSDKEKETLEELKRQRDYLSKKPELSVRIAYTSKAKRANDISKRWLKWLALLIVLLGTAAAGYGIWSLVSKTGHFGIYFMLFGFAAVFLFSGLSVLPTGRNNRRYILKNLKKAEDMNQEYIDGYQGFSLPARYAHTSVLDRMIRVVREGRADSVEQAFDVMKSDLKAINKDVTVTQQEYDEIITIKPMFLIHDYR